MDARGRFGAAECLLGYLRCEDEEEEAEEEEGMQSW